MVGGDKLSILIVDVSQAYLAWLCGMSRKRCTPSLSTLRLLLARALVSLMCRSSSKVTLNSGIRCTVTNTCARKGEDCEGSLYDSSCRFDKDPTVVILYLAFSAISRLLVQ